LSGVNSICGTRIGKQVISFKDGGLLTIKDPGAEIQGLTYGDRVHTIVGTTTIIDYINKLEATVTYNPPKSPNGKGKSGGMLKSLKNKIMFKKSGSGTD
jgi:hypothetical protein